MTEHRSVYKFPVKAHGDTVVPVHYANALTVALDPGGQPCLYAAVKPEEHVENMLWRDGDHEKEKCIVRAVWTGEAIDPQGIPSYKSTLLIKGLIVHFFVSVPPIEY